MHLYKSLYVITEWPEEFEKLSFVSDLRDLGLRDAFRRAEAKNSAQCPIYCISGPEIFNPLTGKKEQAGWVL